MRARAWLLTTLVLGGLALVLTVMQAFYVLPEPRLTTLSQLPAALAFKLLGPPVLIALVFGGMTSGLFALTARLRWGFIFAAVLGYGVHYLMTFAAAFSALSVGDEIFALTFTAYDVPTVPVATAQLSGRTGRPLGSYLFELLGPLTGVLVWALLRRPHRSKTS